jgi:hypothetical protein
MITMAHISQTKHHRLISQIESILHKDIDQNPQAGDLVILKKDLELMIDIFHRYNSNLNELKQLIITYQRIHRRARILLRQQQLAMNVTINI